MFKKKNIIRYKLRENLHLDMTFLKNNLDEDDLKLINPQASYPFVEKEWLDFYKNDNCKSISLYFFDEGEVIGHVALQQNFNYNGMIHLCFFYLKEEYRGLDVAQDFLAQIEKFIKTNFRVSKYYLNVLKHNYRAQKFYEKSGFEFYSKRDTSFKMVKNI